MSVTVRAIFQPRPPPQPVSVSIMLPDSPSLSWRTEGCPYQDIQGTWKHVKVFVNAYNRKTNYIYYLLQYIFASVCCSRAIHPFTMFHHVIPHVDWSLRPAHASPLSPPHRTNMSHCSASFHLPYHAESSRRTLPSSHWKFSYSGRSKVG